MNLKVRKWSALFLTTVLMASILPWPGNSVSASGLFDVTKMMERTETTETTEESETVILEGSETEMNGAFEYAEESETEGEAVPYADIIASGRDNNITWVIDSNGKLTVSGTGDFSSPVWEFDDYNFNYNYNANLWYVYCDQITSAELNVTGMTNACGMFKGCSSLTSLDVSGFDTSNVTSMEHMFSGCSSLTSLDVSGFDTSNVTSMERMFSGCSSLTSLDVSGFDTGKVTDMGGMFDRCSSLTSLDVSGFDTSKVTDIWYMFADCSSLTSVDVSGFDTGNVISMEGMFSDCSSLTSVDVSGFDTGNVIIMVLMFSGCSSLTSVDVSGFDTSKVTDIWYMFNGCSRLSSVNVSGFDTSNVEYMMGMFRNCSGLTSVDMSGFDTRNAISMEEMFDGCSSLTAIHTPYNIPQLVPLPSIPGTVWRLPDGTEVTELPQNLDYSIIITRHDKEKGSAFAVYEGYEFYMDDYGYVTCFNSDGTPVINEFKCDGTYTYYFQTDGTAMRDRLTYHPDGVHVIYFDQNGHEVFDNFAYVGHNIPSMETGIATELNEYCYFNTFGYQYTDVVTWGADRTDRAGKLFYANTGGILERSGWFNFSDTVQYAGDGTLWPGAGKRGYANEADCSLMRETWTYDEDGLYRYINGYGALE